MESAEVGGRVAILSDCSRLTMGLDPDPIRASICALYVSPSDMNKVQDHTSSILRLRDTEPTHV